MIRLIFRSFGILALACAFVALVVDGTRSIAAGEIMMARLGEIAQHALGAKFAALQPLIERNITPLLWSLVVERLLLVPLWLVLAALGIGLVLATQARRDEIGLSSRS